jgi:hypothetical protein
MVRSVTFLTVLFCAATLSAQNPAPERPAGTAGAAPAAAEPAAQQPAPDKSPAAANKVTYTGCVKPGTAPETWILENAEVAKPGQTTAATSGTSKNTLNLTTKMGTDLKPHANHKIEVVGTIAPAKPGAAPAAGPARQEFVVESVKMVSTTCP